MRTHNYIYTNTSSLPGESQVHTHSHRRTQRRLRYTRKKELRGDISCDIQRERETERQVEGEDKRIKEEGRLVRERKGEI